MQLKAIQKLEEEIRVIEEELNGKLPKEIQKAREHGDLSENAEYAAAKERQRLLGVRMTELTGRLARLRLIDMSQIRDDVVGLGSTVVVLDTETGDETVYELVTTEESDVAAGRIATTSPIGRALLGSQDGDVVLARTPRGSKELEILSLKTIHAA